MNLTSESVQGGALFLRLIQDGLEVELLADPKR